MKFCKALMLLWIINHNHLAVSQNLNLDSMASEIMKLPDDTVKVSKLYDIAYDYSTIGEYAKAEKYATMMKEISEKCKFKLGEAWAASIFGTTLAHQGVYHKALEHHFNCLRIHHEMGNKGGVFSAKANIGIVYVEQNQNKKAIDMFQEALMAAVEMKDTSAIAQIYNFIGLTYSGAGYFNKDSAILYLEQSRDLAISLGDVRTQTNAIVNIGVTYTHCGEFEKAIEYYAEAQILYTGINHEYGICLCHGNIGSSLAKLGKFKEAEQRLLKGLECSKNLEIIDHQKNIHEYLSDLYHESGRFDKAFYHLSEYMTLKDSIFNQETKEASLRHEIAFDFEKKEIERKALARAELEKQEAINQQEREQRNIVMYSTIGGLILVFGFSLMLFSRLRVIQRQKKLIEVQKTESDHQKELLWEKNKEITDSINYAKRIQNAILPSRYSLVENLKDGFVLYLPKDIVAGDFYWLERVGDTVFFAAADCTGHGVPGAMVSVVCANALSRALLEERIMEPGKILDRTRHLVIEKLSKGDGFINDGMDISLAAITGPTLVRPGVTLKWAGANNPLWIIRNKAGEVDSQPINTILNTSLSTKEFIEFKPDKQPIGNYLNQSPFTTHEVDLQTGDTIYIFTDGYQDQFGGEKGKKFKASSLKTLLLSIQDETMDNQHNILMEQFNAWRGSLEQIDDVCVIGVRV